MNRHNLLIVCSLIIFTSFANKDSIAEYQISTKSTLNSYTANNQKIKDDRLKLNTLYKEQKITIDSVSKYFETQLINTVIPAWYGTKWDYEGYSNTPQEGEIACGYFVSTTLKHIGVNLNRYKLAQQYSLKAVQTLAHSDSIYKFNHNTSNSITELNSFKKLQDGLYVVGLSNHIGYLLIRNNTPFFIHSTFLEPTAVCIEYAKESAAFEMSSIYYITSISKNKDLMLKWLNNTFISS